MRDNIGIRFAGSGGQGLILASIILAEAALKDNMFAAQSQSYGPEARGGLCKAEVIMSSGEIDYPKVERADFLLALTGESLKKYGADMAEGGLIMADSGLRVPSGISGRIIYLPILETAEKTVGRAVTANIVALGAVNALLRLVERDTLESAVTARVPKGTGELNLRALRAGACLADCGEYAEEGGVS